MVWDQMRRTFGVLTCFAFNSTVGTTPYLTAIHTFPRTLLFSGWHGWRRRVSSCRCSIRRYHLTGRNDRRRVDHVGHFPWRRLRRRFNWCWRASHVLYRRHEVSDAVTCQCLDDDPDTIPTAYPNPSRRHYTRTFCCCTDTRQF